MIKIENLSKTFSVQKKAPGFMGSLKSLFKREYVQKKALDSINLEINSGEIIGLIGANGAGKTTLVKILSGIICKGDGNVSVGGFDPWSRDYKFKSTLSLIMGQKAQLWWDLPASDGFLLLKEIYRIPHDQFQSNIEKLSKKLDVVDQLDTPVRKLSLGERMKVELIAALLHDPKVIFLDEPTIGLDLTSQKAIRSFLKEYMIEKSPTIILTSHYMKDIEELCPRIALMKQGKIIYDGKLETIMNSYASDSILKFETHVDTPELIEYIDQFKFKKSDQHYEIKIKRNEVSETLSKILSLAKIKNLNTHDVEIEDVIENYLAQ